MELIWKMRFCKNGIIASKIRRTATLPNKVVCIFLFVTTYITLPAPIINNSITSILIMPPFTLLFKPLSLILIWGILCFAKNFKISLPDLYCYVSFISRQRLIMIILGIDPALTSTGFAVIHCTKTNLHYVDSGIIKTSTTTPITKRLAHIMQMLENVIVLHKPEMIAMEETFVNMNAVSSLKLGYARGAIMGLIGKKNINFKEFKPNFIKKTIVGVGHAEKQQVLHMIKLLIHNVPNNISLDQADALAVAYVCSMI